jgi:hypothetical protein
MGKIVYPVFMMHDESMVGSRPKSTRAGGVRKTDTGRPSYPCAEADPEGEWPN